jgi:hypothetical protein
MTRDEKEYAIGGLRVHIHGLSTLSKASKIAVVFMLHGRGGSKDTFDETIEKVNLAELNSRKDAKAQLYKHA